MSNSDVWYHADKLAGALAQILRSPMRYETELGTCLDMTVDRADWIYANDVLAEYRQGMHHRRCSQCAYVVTMTEDDLAADAMTEHVATRHRHA